VIFETICLVMMSTFGFALGPFYQTMITTAVLAAVGMLLLAVKPYKCPAANKVAVASVCILCFTAYSAMSFLPYSGVGPGPVYGNIMGAVLVLLNVAFLVGTTWRLLRVVDWAAIKSFASKLCCKEKASTPTAQSNA
jgi:peptidoglycan/LPS O-acetylase OafA/YrhL